MVQGLRLHPSTAWGAGSIPGQGSSTCHTVWSKNQKILKLGLGSQATPPTAFMVYLPLWDLRSSRSTLHEQASSSYLPWSVFWPVCSSQVSPAILHRSLPPPGSLPNAVPPLLPPSQSPSQAPSPY